MPIPKTSISNLRAPVRKFNVDDAVVMERILRDKEAGHRHFLEKRGINPDNIKREDIFKLRKGRFNEETGELTHHGLNWINNALSALFGRKKSDGITKKDFIKAYLEFLFL